MFVSAKQKVGDWQNVILMDADGQPVREAYEADTTEGWYDKRVREGDRLKIENGQLVTERVRAPFTLVSRKTGEVVARSPEV